MNNVRISGQERELNPKDHCWLLWILLTLPFLELTRASPSHLSKLINLWHKKKMNFPPVKESDTSTQFSRREDSPDLPSLTFMLSTSDKFLDKNLNTLPTVCAQTFILALDHESAFFSVQCQLLTLVASGLSSTIHLKPEKGYSYGQGTKTHTGCTVLCNGPFSWPPNVSYPQITWDHLHPTWPLVNELPLWKLLWKWG